MLKRRVLLASSVVLSASAVMAAPTAFAAPQGSCTTGNYIETTTGSDTVGSFGAPSGASSTGCTWTVPAGVTSVRVLVVAGGGGGGNFHTSGGGGGGGVLHEVGYEVTPGASISVTVGKGGNGGPSGGSVADNSGLNGDDSVFGQLVAVGGGGGGGGGSNSQYGVAGKNGGSGGGGGRCWVGCNTSLSTANANKRAGGSATTGQGNRGGDAHFINGAGGGGAGSAGSPSTGSAPGNGGDGVSIDISGAPTYFGGGGGGGTETTATRATGGLGGGGLGGSNDAASGGSGSNGASGTGGGGGGVKSGTPGLGGSGVVMVRWGSAPVAPNISLSNSNGYGIVNSNVGSLYSISNIGGSVTSYSISPSLPAGLSFSTVTGLISGTPTATSSATNYIITARRVDSGNGASSSATATFNFGVYNVAPTTTTTSTSTTTTTVPAATTTVAPAASGSSPGSTFVTIPSGNVTETSTVVTPTTAAIKSSTATSTVAANVTTTTVPPTTTTTEPAPVTPEAAPGEAGATVDGEPVKATVTREDNALVVAAGEISATVYGLTSDGERVSLDADGNLQLDQLDRVVISASGYAPQSDVEIWLRSTPTKLAVVTADVRGDVSGTFSLPKGIDSGNHRVVLSGRTKSGGDSVIGLGLRIGSFEKESGINRMLIASALALAIILALVIPTTVRRRKRANV